MSWSLGEVRALAVKAARGAGFSWGLAEEAGYAVHWLQARGAPGAAALARYFDNREAAPPAANAAPGRTTDCPITLGAALSDGSLDLDKTAGPLRQPLLLAPFLAALPGARRLAWDGVDVVVSAADFATTAEAKALLSNATEWRTEPAVAPARPCLCHDRVPDSEAPFIHILEDFCARTYAPATEQSRLLGAGSGREDDD